MADRPIAHYNLLERIGEDGLGTVYRARDTKIGRTVTLKVLPPEISTDPIRSGAMVDDALAAAALSHPNIATLFEAGNADGVRYLAYEFVSGAPLANRLAGGPMNPRRAVELASQVADALAAMHAAGLYHRDLSPATIAVTDKGAAKLLDCGMHRWTLGGVARRAAAADPSSLNPDAMTSLTSMAPEQALGDALDARADIFSLGTVLYTMLTGANPFAAASPHDAVISVITLQPSPVSSANPDIPPELDAVVARAMSKDIASRYESAAALAAELRRAAATLDQLPEDEAAGYMLPIDETIDKVPNAVWFAVVAGLAGVGAIAWWSLR